MEAASDSRGQSQAPSAENTPAPSMLASTVTAVAMQPEPGNTNPPTARTGGHRRTLSRLDGTELATRLHQDPSVTVPQAVLNSLGGDTSFLVDDDQGTVYDSLGFPLAAL